MFIGQYLPYHADIQTEYPELVNSVEKIAESYYRSLNIFFERIEQVSGGEVVIVEHPSGVHNTNPFNGRKIFYYKTAELVKDAKAVCMHCSNSLNFVALYNKPVAFLECIALKSIPNVLENVRNYAQMVGSHPLNIDAIDKVDDAIFRLIDNDLRAKYVSKMRGGNNKATNDKLYISCFKSIFKEMC